MKPIILIPSCSRDKSNEQICRETWLGAWGGQCDYRFMIGAPCTLTHPDEEYARESNGNIVPDDFSSLPRKVHASYRWVLEHGYTHVFKCDTETWVHITRLLNSDFARASYIGYVPPYVKVRQYAHGGSGYWLDRAAMEAVVRAIPPRGGNEDEWVGDVLKDAGIHPTHDERYTLSLNAGDKIPDTVISVHAAHDMRDVVKAHATYGMQKEVPKAVLDSSAADDIKNQFAALEKRISDTENDISQIKYLLDRRLWTRIKKLFSCY